MLMLHSRPSLGINKYLIQCQHFELNCLNCSPSNMFNTVIQIFFGSKYGCNLSVKMYKKKVENYYYFIGEPLVIHSIPH